jgi:hypothetical protein
MAAITIMAIAAMAKTFFPIGILPLMAVVLRFFIFVTLKGHN